jgi:hypothetical protein
MLHHIDTDNSFLENQPVSVTNIKTSAEWLRLTNIQVLNNED